MRTGKTRGTIIAGMAAAAAVSWRHSNQWEVAQGTAIFALHPPAHAAPGANTNNYNPGAMFSVKRSSPQTREFEFIDRVDTKYIAVRVGGPGPNRDFTTWTSDPVAPPAEPYASERTFLVKSPFCDLE
jgi:hypothetical protein